MSGKVQSSNNIGISGATVTTYTDAAHTNVAKIGNSPSLVTSGSDGTWSLTLAKNVDLWVVVTPPTNYSSSSVTLGTSPSSITISQVSISEIKVNAPDGAIVSGNLFILALNNPVPTITSTSPANKCAGDVAFTLTINGTNFISSSIVQWNGTARTTNFVSSTQLTAAITATNITTAGSFPITVVNGAPGGGTSNSVDFTVNAPPTVALITSGTTTTNVCVGSAVQLSNSTPGGVWGTTTPTLVSVSATGLVTGILGGSANITYTVTNEFGCSTIRNKTVNVIAQPNAPTAGNYNAAYDGVSHTGSATPGSGETIDWYANATGTSTAAAPVGTNFGTYTAWAEARNTTTGCVSATRTQVTVTINKATPAITLTVGANPTYDGLAHYVTSATVAGVGSPAVNLGNATVVYKLSGSPVAAPTNAGAYAVTADFAETANYFAADQKTGTLTIDKADAVIHVDPYTVTFDGLPHTSQFTAVGVENPNPVSLVALMHVDATTQTNAGTYTDVAWTFDGNGNYNATGGTVTNTIGKATPAITLTVGANPTYDGLAHYVTSATVAGVGSPAADLGNATVVYKLSGSPVAAPTNAGAYAVTADFAETANYFAADQKTDTLAIDKVLVLLLQQ